MYYAAFGREDEEEVVVAVVLVSDSDFIARITESTAVVKVVTV